MRQPNGIDRMIAPEQLARLEIDRLLAAAGWRVFDLAEANLHAARGVALREFPLAAGHGFADYLLYVDGKAAGVIEAKKQGLEQAGQGQPGHRLRWQDPARGGLETGPQPHCPGQGSGKLAASPAVREHGQARPGSAGGVVSRLVRQGQPQ